MRQAWRAQQAANDGDHQYDEENLALALQDDPDIMADGEEQANLESILFKMFLFFIENKNMKSRQQRAHQPMPRHLSPHRL